MSPLQMRLYFRQIFAFCLAPTTIKITMSQLVIPIQSFLQSFKVYVGHPFPLVEKPKTNDLREVVATVKHTVDLPEEGFAIFYSYVVDDVEYGFQLSTHCRSNPELKIRYDMKYPMWHQILGTRFAEGSVNTGAILKWDAPETFKRIHYVGSCSVSYHDLFQKITEGDWQRVSAICKEVVRTFRPQSAVILLYALYEGDQGREGWKLVQQPLQNRKAKPIYGCILNQQLITRCVAGDSIQYIYDLDRLIGALLVNELCGGKSLPNAAKCFIANELANGLIPGFHDLQTCALLAELWGAHDTRLGHFAIVGAMSYKLLTLEKALVPYITLAFQQSADSFIRIQKAVNNLIARIVEGVMYESDTYLLWNGVISQLEGIAAAAKIDVDLAVLYQKRESDRQKYDEEDRKKIAKAVEDHKFVDIDIDPKLEPELYQYLMKKNGAQKMKK